MRRELARTSSALAIGLGIGLALGIWIGSSASQPEVDPNAEHLLAEDERTAAAREGGSRAARWRAQILADALTSLIEARRPVAREAIGDLLRLGDGAEELSRLVIDEMSDRELISAITSFTALTRTDLDEVSDLRRYAHRLTEIAMSGVVTDPLPTPFGTSGVRFATSANTLDGAVDPRGVFDPEDRKIYAVFPSERYEYGHVVVHWYHSGDPELLLFDRYLVKPGDEFSYVWLERPRGWEPGEYRVEVYSGDEELRALAVGSYRISDSRDARVASTPPDAMDR